MVGSDEGGLAWEEGLRPLVHEEIWRGLTRRERSGELGRGEGSERLVCRGDREQGEGTPGLRQVLGRMLVGWVHRWAGCPSGAQNPLFLSPGGSTSRPSLTSVACATQLPAMRFWLWPGTWNCQRGEPCPLLGTVPSSQTSPCPARLSALVCPGSWAASPSPSWPGPVWHVCPGSGLRLHPGLGPSAETFPTLRLSALHLCC